MIATPRSLRNERALREWFAWLSATRRGTWTLREDRFDHRAALSCQACGLVVEFVAYEVTPAEIEAQLWCRCDADAEDAERRLAGYREHFGALADAYEQYEAAA